MSQNWRTPVDAGDYFNREKKRADIDNRRPVFRRASDLVGPGISASAIGVTDWNDTLATFNGYYCSAPDAANAPNDSEAFIGFVVMDAEVGGTQTVTGMTSEVEYKRLFWRNPADPDFITWGEWSRGRDRVAATLESAGVIATNVGNTVPTDLAMPNIVQIGDVSPWNVAGARLNITLPGVYTGHLILSNGVDLANLTVTHPSLSGLATITRANVTAFSNKWLPLTFATTATNLYVSVSVTQNTGASENVSITGLALTRVSQI